MGIVNPARANTAMTEAAGQLAEANALSALLAEFNGNIDTANLKAGAGIVAGQLADADKLGLTTTTTTRRGKSIIATEETRTNAAFGLLATPDQVPNVAVSQDAIVIVSFKALWKESVAQAGRAALFIGGNQFKKPSGSGTPKVTAAMNDAGATVDTYAHLFSHPVGLLSQTPAGSAASDVTTGQALTASGGVYESNASGTPTALTNEAGGFCIIENLAAGTYTFSIQFKSASGSVSVKERRLRVWVQGF